MNKMSKLKTRNVRFEDWLWEELEKVSKKTDQDKSKFVRIAVMEKIQRIERGEKNERTVR
jgi:metal-responsive CopG/Arc/MetJ family transcriptional regulator